MIIDKNDPKYQQCKISVMDNIADPDITFDEKGICNYYYEYLAAEKESVFKGSEGERKIKAIVEEIKSKKTGKYDCILGLSGGVDSSFLAILAKEHGLSPLVVHFDYGWNTELAVHNIETTVKKLDFDLYTYVMDWPEFRELQRSYFKASVLDLDVPADHMIFGALYKIANKYNIKYVLSGNNVMTEHTLPKTWNYNKFDLVNLKDIHAKFSKMPLKKLPKLGLWQFAYYQLVKNVKSAQLLNLVDYNKSEVKRRIMDELNWKDYGGKHHESVFTRFYQGYILPNKFHIDKRKAHLSNLIFSGQLTKEEALSELSQPTYNEVQQAEDITFVGKKLGFAETEFKEILTLPNKSHYDYKTDHDKRKLYFKLMKAIKPLTQIIKKLR